MGETAINFAEKFAKFSEQWSPKIIAQMNDYHFKIVKIQGEFVWHQHAETDEVFIVMDGELTIHLRDGDVTLKAVRCTPSPAVSSTSRRRRASAA
jgi:mannose-6-phosphate isomerase-like protein (cupin superfamily)